MKRLGMFFVLAMLAGTANAARVEYLFTADDAANALCPCNGIMPETMDLRVRAVFVDGVLTVYTLTMFDMDGFPNITLKARKDIQGQYGTGFVNITYSPRLIVQGDDVNGYDIVISETQWTFRSLVYGKWKLVR